MLINTCLFSYIEILCGASPENLLMVVYQVKHDKNIKQHKKLLKTQPGHKKGREHQFKMNLKKQI